MAVKGLIINSTLVKMHVCDGFVYFIPAAFSLKTLEVVGVTATPWRPQDSLVA